MSNLTNLSEIKEILNRHGFTFSKAMGQNFLVNPSVCPKMAELCGADENTGVLEIGPGIGVLTRELSRCSRKVAAVELDRRLLPVLEETLADCGNVNIIGGDIMSLDLHRLIAEQFGTMDVVVCANLPYYITSPIIMRLLEEKLPIKAITVMVQKEAAQRICAPVGTRECGAVTVAVNYYSSAQLLFHVSRGSFIPSPNVDSAVIRLSLTDKAPLSVNDEHSFFRLVRAAFSQRRKTLANSLSSGLSIPKPQINAILEQAGVSPTLRAEQLSMEQFAAVANFLGEAKNEQ